jgi:hypothetical protein
MDSYHVWCNLKPGVADLEFVRNTRAYLDQLQALGKVAAYRITRCKLGLRRPLSVTSTSSSNSKTLRSPRDAFATTAMRADPVEGFHHAVNSIVSDVSFALYRDFPNAGRVTGQERFEQRARVEAGAGGLPSPAPLFSSALT